MPMNPERAALEARKSEEKKLDEAAMLWKTTPQEGNEARIQKYYNDVLILAHKLYGHEPRKSSEEKKEFYNEDTFTKALKETLRKYDPSCGKFSHYFSKIFSRRKIDDYRAERASAEAISLETPLSPSGAEESLALGDTIPDAKSEEQQETRMRMDGLFVELTSLALNFAHRTGKANNAQHRMWWKMFYTEDMTYVLKQYIPRYLHERDIFEAMDLEYLDYYMEDKCRTGSKVMCTPLKPYREVVPNKEGRIPLPVPVDVSLAYLKDCHKIDVGQAARSNQFKKYKEDKADIYAKSNT